MLTSLDNTSCGGRLVVKSNKKFKLLVADPSPSLRAVLEQVGEDCSMAVTLCTSCAEARAILAGRVFDLAIVANEFPDGRYFDLLSMMRGHPAMALSPVLLMLASHNDTLTQEALDQGITDVFHKRNMDDMARYLESFGAAASARKKKRRRRPRALVIEDEHALGAYYKALLVQLGFAAEHIPSAEAALSEVERRRYEFILVDLVLGAGCSGIQFLRRLRQPANASSQAVAIAMSAYSDETRRLEALRAGASAFISKPVNERELAAHAEGMAMRPSSEPEEAEQEADSEAEGVLVAGAHPCTRCQPCLLTPRESNICTLVISGYSDKRIAEEMGVSYWTVRTHIAHAFKKCDVVNRVELVRRLQGV